MKFFTSQQQPVKPLQGSHLIGVFGASYDTIKAAFGDPQEGEDDKIQVVWYIQFEDGTIASIYDWKQGASYRGEGCGIHFSDVDEWHVGGIDEKAMLRVSEVIDAVSSPAAQAAAPAAGAPSRARRRASSSAVTASSAALHAPAAVAAATAPSRAPHRAVSPAAIAPAATAPRRASSRQRRRPAP